MFFLHSEASNIHTYNFNPSTDEVEIMQLKTEPNELDELYSDGKKFSITDSTRQTITESKIF